MCVHVTNPSLHQRPQPIQARTGIFPPPNRDKPPYPRTTKSSRRQKPTRPSKQRHRPSTPSKESAANSRTDRPTVAASPQPSMHPDIPPANPSTQSPRPTPTPSHRPRSRPLLSEYHPPIRFASIRFDAPSPDPQPGGRPSSRAPTWWNVARGDGCLDPTRCRPPSVQCLLVRILGPRPSCPMIWRRECPTAQGERAWMDIRGPIFLRIPSLPAGTSSRLRPSCPASCKERPDC